MAGALTAACTCRSPRRRRCCASQPSGSSAWAKWRRCVGRRRRWSRCWASAAPASRPSAARSSTSCSWRTCATLRPRPHDPLAHVRCCCCCMCHARSHEVVAFLDCDVGQPELTPPGLLSLHLLTEPLFGTCPLLAARCWLVVVEGADRHHRPELHTSAPASEVRPLQRGSASSVRLAAHARPMRRQGHLLWRRHTGRRAAAVPREHQLPVRRCRFDRCRHPDGHQYERLGIEYGLRLVARCACAMSSCSLSRSHSHTWLLYRPWIRAPVVDHPLLGADAHCAFVPQPGRWAGAR